MSQRGNIFKDIPVDAPVRSWIDKSFGNVLSMNMGKIVPTICQECLPKDYLKHKSSKFVRVAPMLSPVFGKLNLFSYKFYVRYCDIATYFDSFIANADQRLDWQQNQSEYVPPVIAKFYPLDMLTHPVCSPPLAYVDDVASRTSVSYTTLHDSALTTAAKHYIDWYSGKIQGGLPRYAAFNILALERQEDGSFLVSRNRGMRQLEDLKLNSFYIIYRPNLSEYDNYWKNSLSENDVYGFEYAECAINPLSPGTLLDYLGIDVKGYYLKQYDYFYQSMSFMAQIWSSDVATSTMYTQIKDSFDLKGFMNTHYVQGVIMVGNGWSAGTSPNTSKYQFVTADGFVDIATYTGMNSADKTAFDSKYYFKSTWRSQGDSMQECSMLPIHAYNFVYNEYFRDQNLIPINDYCDFDQQGVWNVPFAGSFGGNESTDYNLWYHYFMLQNKAWEHDSFTSALPGPQRGPAVRFLSDFTMRVNADNVDFLNGSSVVGLINKANSDGVLASGAKDTISALTTTGDLQMNVDVSIPGATIESFRWANAMQKFFEKKARTGNRKYELLKGLWDIEVEDAKIHRPIYLSGDKQPIQISEVLQTGSTNTDTNQPLGDLAGRGTSVGSDDSVEYLCPDYGFYMEFICILPRTSYMRGLNRKWTRFTYLDYPWPDFAKLGEELIHKNELLFDGTNLNLPFGYNPRYYDWRYNYDEVHGEFKESLNYWHFARDFDKQPGLTRSFIESGSDYRQFAVSDPGYHHFYVSCDNDLQVQTSLPANPIPDL